VGKQRAVFPSPDAAPFDAGFLHRGSQFGGIPHRATWILREEPVVGLTRKRAKRQKQDIIKFRC
jgi:hypothetical protein